MYERRGGFTSRRISLPGGDAGTRTTLEHMGRLAIEGSKDLEVRSAAIAALDRYGGSSHEPFAALGALHRFVRDQIRFVGDPVGAQAIQSPRATLEFAAGNCAQRATLLAAMARSIGIPARINFRTIAANPRFPRTFSHVYVVADVRGKRVALDPTYPDVPAGMEYPHRTRVADWPVSYQLQGCEGCPGMGLLPVAAKMVGGHVLGLAMGVGKCYQNGVPIACRDTAMVRLRAAAKAAGGLKQLTAAVRSGATRVDLFGPPTPVAPRITMGRRGAQMVARAQQIMGERRAQARVGATPSQAIEAPYATAPVGASSYARETDLSAAAAGSAPAIAPDETTGASAAPGPGIGIAIALGIALLAFAGRK